MIRSSKNAFKLWLPIGSPILDFLVTGDDFSIVDLLQQLGTNSTTTEKDVSDGILSSIDHCRPAQAVSSWVQCENPDCQEWRKIPWDVDIDIPLYIGFFCEITNKYLSSVLTFGTPFKSCCKFVTISVLDSTLNRICRFLNSSFDSSVTFLDRLGFVQEQQHDKTFPYSSIAS
jgi:hypothetical protein